MEITEVNPSKDLEMKIRWAVGDLKGLRLLKNPSQDIFETYEAALEECINRGEGFAPFALDPQAVVMDLLHENFLLKKENTKLRKALD